MSSLSLNILKCVAVLKTGLNKGLICKNNAKYGTHCGIHKKNTAEINPISVSLSEPVLEPFPEPIPKPIPKPIPENKLNHEIYIIKLAEHIRCKDNIFKVGMTTRGVAKRLKGYPKNSKILFSTKVKNAKLCERFVLENCRKDTNLKKCDRNNKEQYKRLGNEYFEGDYKLLLNLVKTSCEKFNKS